MKLSLFWKIFTGHFIIIVVLAIVVPVLSFQAIRDHHTKTFSEHLKSLAIALSRQVGSCLEARQTKDLDGFIKDLGRQVQTRVTVIGKDGKVLADSQRDPAAMENHGTRPEVAEALRGTVGKSIRFSVTVDEEMIYVALPVEKDKALLGVVRVSTTLKQMTTLLTDLKMRIAQVAFILTLISLLIAYLVSRSISRPVENLVETAKNLAKGDFSTRIYLRDGGELRELAATFNDMASRMRSLFEDMERRNEELQRIMSSIQELLLLVDKDGRIRLSNESFQKLVGIEAVEGKFYWEVFRSPQFGELVKRAKDEKRAIVDKVEFNGQVFLCSTTYLASEEEILAVLHDITDFKSLERMKRDFVSNISHELRTPLTAIKGFVETIEEEEEIKNVQYLEIIKRHTDRLMNIVNDLLLLSELEEKGHAPEFQDVSLVQIVENILRIFERRAREKGILLELNLDPAADRITGDPFKLEQMLINLVDNAVKYTETGTLSIATKRKDVSILIEVSDTGIGILREHLSRIFERFYVVDKSRSKRLGGTGLGLSIVKHIVLLHNGSIDVESSKGKGTRFIVTLPSQPV